LSNRSDALLTADAAARRDGAEALRRVEPGFDFRAQMNSYDVFTIARTRWSGEFLDRIRLSNDPFRKEKTGGKFVVETGRPHGYSNSLAANPNLERLFNREIVRKVLQRGILFASDDFAGCDALVFH